MVNLGLGQSPFPVPPSIVEELRRHAHEKDYLPCEGLPELRDAIVDFHSEPGGTHFHRDLTVIGPGLKELIFLTQLCQSGALVLPTPSWVSYGPQASIARKVCMRIHTQMDQEWKLDFAKLDEMLSGHDRALLLLNTPNNPHGCGYTSVELEKLAEICRRHNTIVYSDEIYALTEFSGTSSSISRFYPEGTIVSSGLSKWCGAGGWRLGYCLFPEELKDLHYAVCAVASETFTSVCAPIQYAALSAFGNSAELLGYRSNIRKILGALCGLCCQMLREGGYRVCMPVGAFYLFPDASPFRSRLKEKGIVNGTDFCARLLEEMGVACLPGTDFGRDDSEMNFRISLVDFDGGKALESASLKPEDWHPDENWLETHCSPVIQGCRDMISFVS